jgi:hypothetical protein
MKAAARPEPGSRTDRVDHPTVPPQHFVTPSRVAKGAPVARTKERVRDATSVSRLCGRVIDILGRSVFVA